MKDNLKPIPHFIIIGLVLIFPFTSNPAAINFEKDMMLTKDQELVQEMSESINQLIGENNCILHSNPYLSLTLSLNHFDPSVRKEFTKGYMSYTAPGDLLVWDSWFSVTEHGILIDELRSNSELLKLDEFSVNASEQDIRYVIFRRR